MEDKLYMPSNISTEDYIFSGVGKKEMKYLIVLSSIGITLGFIVSIIFSFQVGVIAVFLSVIGSYFLVAKNPTNNNSIMNGIVSIYKFFTKQNVYKYKYKEWWEEFEDVE